MLMNDTYEQTMLMYEAVAQKLGNEILRLIPIHPKILTFTNAFDLFRFNEFTATTCDLQCSLAQASTALKWAKQEFLRLNPIDNQTVIE